MARRRKKQESIAGSFVLLLMLVVFFMSYSGSQSTGTAIFSSMLVFLLCFAVMLVFRKANQLKLKRSHIDEIDQMSGVEFEQYLAELFRSQGYTVQLTPQSNDFGGDLVLQTSLQKIVVQAKRHKSNVGIKAVQEVIGAKAHYKADEAWVVTNSFFTDQAQRLAHSAQVRLIDRSELIGLILRMNPSVVPDPSQVLSTANVRDISTAPWTQQTVVVCERCGKKMVVRKGPRGEFLGCTGYPKCKNTKDWANTAL